MKESAKGRFFENAQKTDFIFLHMIHHVAAKQTHADSVLISKLKIVLLHQKNMCHPGLDFLHSQYTSASNFYFNIDGVLL